MPKYRKKHEVIEARKFTTNNDTDEACMNAIVGWIVNNGGKASHNGTDIMISSPGGDQKVMCGDYIIKDGKEDFCPCNAALFESIYEPAD